MIRKHLNFSCTIWACHYLVNFSISCNSFFEVLYRNFPHWCMRATSNPTSLAVTSISKGQQTCVCANTKSFLKELTISSLHVTVSINTGIALLFQFWKRFFIKLSKNVSKASSKMRHKAHFVKAHHASMLIIFQKVR